MKRRRRKEQIRRMIKIGVFNIDVLGV